MKHYNLDDIITMLKQEKSKYTSFLKGWRKVTFPTKKDGTPYKSMQKNISGAKYESCQFAIQDGEKQIRITINDPLNGWVSDVLYCYETVKHMKDPAKIAKTENFAPKEIMLEQIYCYDLDDIKEAINNRISELETKIQELEEQITAAHKIYNDFKQAYSAAMKSLERACDKWKNKTLFYAIGDTVKERYPYC